ncbi:MAG: phosphate signaling complex protein PhoU [Spirochaetes bacterium]|nr:MAG: phosphate signaling complex protein PhoU [Spirochaetota bacterium]
MPTHLEQELEHAKMRIFEMADLAIEAIHRSVEAYKKSDGRLANEVIQSDNRLDELEKLIDDECIRILVTKQPAAADLRLVLAMLKINTDLERIGDFATAIAKEAIRLNGRAPLKPLVDIPIMAQYSVEMLKECFLAMTEKSTERARKVIERDADIDALNVQVYRELISYMLENPATISQALGLIMVSKALERIGDHATNIAERAIYYIGGEDIRHSK